MEWIIFYFWILLFWWLSFGDIIKPALKKEYAHWSFLWEDPLSEEELHEMIKSMSQYEVDTYPMHDGEIIDTTIDDFFKEE